METGTCDGCHLTKNEVFFFCSTSLWYKRQQQREIAWSASQAGWTELVKVVVLILFNQLVMLITRLCVAVVVLHYKLVEHVILMGFFFWSSHWNNRRSRRVFLCFYSAIFQLTSAKFQTFAYNSRTVGSSYMKFWQQFEINELHVCTKFRGNRSRDFGFRTGKPPRKCGVKSGLSQKRLNPICTGGANLPPS